MLYKTLVRSHLQKVAY